MDFDVVRQYLVDSGIVPKCTNKKDHRKKYDAIFLLDKPEEIEADTFLVYRYRLDEGGIVKKYRFEIDVYSKDITTGEELKNKIKDCLDFRYRPIEIDEFVKFSLSDEDGFLYMDALEIYKDTLYFKCNSLL